MQMISTNLNDVYFNGKYHSRIYKGNKLVWEKKPKIKYEFVDLGLSVDWCTANIGAAKPEELGWYFAWGETVPYNADRTPVEGGEPRVFDSSTYRWCNGTETSLTKYNSSFDYGIIDNKTTLDKEDDAAYIYVGNDCRMPTKEEIEELLHNYTVFIGIYDGVPGFKVISKTDNSKELFFPDSGSIYDNVNYVPQSPDDRYLSFRYNLWSNTLFSDYRSYCLDCREECFDTDDEWYSTSMGAATRFYGLPIRAVRKSREWVTGNDGITYEFMDLGLSVMWATANVGASSYTEIGKYFAWGETEEKESYDWTNYKWCNGTSTSITKYNPFNADIDLEPEDDAASVNISNECHTPTNDEFIELFDACNVTHQTNYNGSNVEGFIFTLKTNKDKSIFFPLCGYKNGSARLNAFTDVNLWTATKPGNKTAEVANQIYAYLYSKSPAYGTSQKYKYMGVPVRAVKSK